MESRNGGCNSVANKVQYAVVFGDQQLGLPAASFAFTSILRSSK